MLFSVTVLKFLSSLANGFVLSLVYPALQEKQGTYYFDA